MGSFKVFLTFLCFRVFAAVIMKTFYVPDEYWQSLEVGHKVAFGYGHLTWEWQKGIRSYVHPLIIAGIYKLLAFFDLDTLPIMTIAPRILQAVLSAFSDYRFFVWNGRKKWSAFLILTSWFWFYTGSRTLSNTVETALTTIALSYFPWRKGNESSTFLWFVSIATFLRPTAVIPWIPLFFYHIEKSKFSVFELLFKRYLLIGLLVGAIGMAIDTQMYGKMIFTPWEFIKLNVLEGIGSTYGTHPWYWYFSVGLPTVLGIGTLTFVLAMVEVVRHRKLHEYQTILLMSIVCTLCVYSLIPHKEFRFVLQLLPFCLYISTDFLAKWSRNASQFVIWLVVIALFVGNLVPAGYLSLVHQRGSIDVMAKVANIAREYKDENGHAAKIFFLMPCHSTPFYSHVHANATLRFLSCEPNFAKSEDYVDEADQFYKDPMKWIRSHLPVHPRTALPTHVVLFDVLAPRISDFLSIYQPIDTFFHADYASERVGKNVLLYERTDPTRFTKPPPAVTDPPRTTKNDVE